jgi:hypothetical protein
MSGYKHITPNWTTNGKGCGDVLGLIIDIDMYVELHGGKTTPVEDCQNGRWAFKAMFHHEGEAVEIGFFVEDGDGFYANAAGGGTTYRIDPGNLFESLEPIGLAFGPKTAN